VAFVAVTCPAFLIGALFLVDHYLGQGRPRTDLTR
jgi:hypothetical protein